MKNEHGIEICCANCRRPAIENAPCLLGETTTACRFAFKPSGKAYQLRIRELQEELLPLKNREKLEAKSVASNGLKAKLPYADIKRMVKPLEWENDAATLDLGDGYFVNFNIKRNGQDDILGAEIEIEDCAFTLDGGFTDKQSAKNFLAKFVNDFVAAALGVERGGK